MHYLVNHEGHLTGPYTVAELQRLVGAGELLPRDTARPQGDDTAPWVPLETLLPDPGAGPPPPAPLFIAARPPVPPPVIAPIPQSPGMPPRDFPLPEDGPRIARVGAPPPSGAGVTLRRRKRVLWPWVLAGGLLALVALVVAAGFLFLKEVGRRTSYYFSSQKPLFEERQGNKTKWRESDFEASGPADPPPAGVFELVKYRSEAGELAAYLTPDPKDGKRHPAVVWAHGGFGGIGSYLWEEASRYDDQSTNVFREAGLVVMAPSWRGENDNPGRFELFYGEVNDLLAAVQHVKRLPYVDPGRVYVAGHSTGGTLAVLLGTATTEPRAVFSFGGMMDGKQVLHESEGFGNTPFDESNLRECLLRSPLRYTQFIRRPVFYFEGTDNDYFLNSARATAQRARALKVPFHAYGVPGNHFDILHPVTRLLVQKIREDTGPECNIRFAETELAAAYDRSFPLTPRKVLADWLKNGGDLAKVLAGMDDEDLEPRTTRDVELMRDAAKKLATQPASPEVMTLMEALAALADATTDDDVYELQQEEFRPVLFKWARARLEGGIPFAPTQPGRDGGDAGEAANYLHLLRHLQDHEEKEGEVLQLVVQAARLGVAAEDYTWSALFRHEAEDAGGAEALMKAIRGSLPPGFAGVALLDAANQARLNHEWKGLHPYDTAEGEARLRAWLEDKDPGHFSHAHSAAVGLAFVSSDRRARLLPAALSHPEAEVKLEGAWADLKNGGARGLQVLREAALEVHQSSRAVRYLKELDHGKDIPPAALEPDFAARASMSGWLQHPNEIGTAPLTLEPYHQAELHWPPLGRKVPVWLFKFTYRFAGEEGSAAVKTGYGMVGGMTWSFFDDEPLQPTPASLYLKHCTLEMQRRAEDEEEEAAEESTPAVTPGMPPAPAADASREAWRDHTRRVLRMTNPEMDWQL